MRDLIKELLEQQERISKEVFNVNWYPDLFDDEEENEDPVPT